MNQLGKFYVVTHPTPHSTLDDICFMTDAIGLMRQTMGGLRPDQVVLVTPSEFDAERLALQLLRQRDLAEEVKR